MDLLQTIFITLATLAILVAVHEYGHFWVARRCGVKVLRFSIGFGRPLARWHDRLGTEYTLAAIPLGGYVKMLDEREGEVPTAELGGAFNRKPVLQRIAVVAAGPLANFLLAIVAYWGLFLAGESGYAPLIDKVEAGSVADLAGLEPGQEVVAVDGRETPTWQALSFRLLERIGDTGEIRFTARYPDSDIRYESSARLDAWLAGEEEPDLLGGIGLKLFTPPVEPRADEIVPGGAAERAGLAVGDLVLSADGRPMPLWEDWVAFVRERPGQAIDLRVRRENGSEFEARIVPEPATSEAGEPIGRIGMAVAVPPMPEHLRRDFERGPVEALGAGIRRTGELISFTLESVRKMLQGLISPKNLSGPITIAKVASTSAKSGLESYIGFLALLSVSLGVLNLLPIPVLDGGHLLYYAVELVVGRPVPERIQAVGYQVGLFLVISLMMLALYNDFARL
ncbi:RIP metalloprotease RseP [Pseudohaliea rubra]|uniref:Zinc metalloprotease n=1 Tax=Pseudohaliea rubra DSM 19751 TaxID=1265313 RepID=A0A095XXM6_9GAMM|nr:RIP metalloprotease RseP [Pseudohaliea rubra]KGE04486.1 Membrane-associated zinc metalloprotease [Pseudohaliea rubra DSM 19751]